jgi:hypothetical protein
MDDVKPHNLYYQQHINQKEEREKGRKFGKENTKDYDLRLKYTHSHTIGPFEVSW